MIGIALTAIGFDGAAVRATSGRSRNRATHATAARIAATVIAAPAVARTDHRRFRSAGGVSAPAAAATDGSIR